MNLNLVESATASGCPRWPQTEFWSVFDSLMHSLTASLRPRKYCPRQSATGGRLTHVYFSHAFLSVTLSRKLSANIKDCLKTPENVDCVTGILLRGFQSIVSQGFYLGDFSFYFDI